MGSLREAQTFGLLMMEIHNFWIEFSETFLRELSQGSRHKKIVTKKLSQRSCHKERVMKCNRKDAIMRQHRSITEVFLWRVHVPRASDGSHDGRCESVGGVRNE